MRWWMPCRRETRRHDEALLAAEQLRDRAVEQQRRVEAITPRVDAATASLRRIRDEDHLGPMIKNVVLRVSR
jgi:hypothetical protein